MTDPTASPSHRRRDRRVGSSALRATVLAADVVALAMGWAGVLAWVAVSTGERVSSQAAWAGLAAVVVTGMLALRSVGAHERRIVRVRSRELAVTSKAALAPAALLLALLPQPTLGGSLLLAAIGAALWIALLAVSRAAIGEWVRGNRARGHLGAPVVVVGTGRSAELAAFLRDHPHLGFTVADVVELIPDDGDHVELLRDVAATVGATGIIVADPGDPVIQPLVPALSRVGLHVHVATGVLGLELRTAVTSSMAGELFLDFAPHRLPRWEAAAIRAVDCVVAALVLLVTLPVSLAVAAAIRLTDGGRVLYRQERVGRDDETFSMLKFRSMTDGAPAPVPSAGDNGRHGPLTKIASDPRITRVGRLIRATSIDELPQLVNVLRGDMSLVGPRPALPSEVAEFDAELRRRTEVRPGLTGLWQVEGRDLPSFELYRRLDLLYVDNQSLSLHLAVLLRTATALVGQTIRSLLNGSESTLRPEEHRSGADDLVVLPNATRSSGSTAPNS